MTDHEYRELFEKAAAFCADKDDSERQASIARTLVKVGRSQAVFAAVERAGLTGEQLEKLAQWLKEEA